MESISTFGSIATVAFIAVCITTPPSSYSLVDLPRRNITYTWKTGAWGACYSPRLCGEGSRERSIRCMDSEGLNALEPNCDSKSRPTSVQNCFKVCEEHRFKLRWHVGRWSSCAPPEVEPRRQRTDPCHETTGLAVRNISCIYIPDGGQPVKIVEGTACEYFEHRPDSEMTCTVPCPQDCVVSNFSEWSLCDSCKVKHRTRVRTVLVAPSGGGKSCPPLSEMAPCDAVASCFQQHSPDHQFLLKIGRWGPCQPIDDDGHHELHSSLYTHHPRVGQRVRSVTCLNSEGEVANMSYCHHKDMEEVEFFQSCIVPQECRISPWSEWAVVKEGCVTSEGHIFTEVRVRTRQLLHLPAGDSQLCPPLREKRIISKDLSPCYKYKWVPSEWGDCVIVHQEEQDYSEILKPLCGGGIQKRNLTCLRASDLVPVSLTFCKEISPVTIQRCNVPCPRNCMVSEWSQWSSCLPSEIEKNLYFPEKGYEERRRTILVEPTSDGTQCPHLHEVNFCDDVKLYKWEYGPWSECILKEPEKECGEGIKNRTVKCMKEDGTEVRKAMCNIHTLPVEGTDTCYIPCPEDCTVSDWSPWSLCTVQCFDASNPEMQIKNKSILAPAAPGGRQCPSSTDLEEGMFCNQGSCTGFHWKTLPWEECQPLNDEMCGEGTQEREVYCVRGQDYIANDRKCEVIPKPLTEQACNVPCPVDCITTEFSDWTPCPNNCDTETVQSRERYILQWPHHGGKPCPSALVEAKVCSAKNELLCLRKSIANLTTYHWDTSSWSICILPNEAKCGRGYQTRKLACVQGDGKEVEPFHCLPKSNGPLHEMSHSNEMHKIPNAFRLCFVSCNTSCSVSDWSPWNCDNYCGSVRRRTRELIGPRKSVHLCQKHFHTKEEGDLCLAAQAVSRSSHWLDCIITENNATVKVNGETITGRCGRGYKYRRGTKINETTCLQSGLQEDVCLIECSFDCKMSLWSVWSPCNTTCGMGYKHRRREIISQANKFGRPCPSTEEDAEVQTDVCIVPCDHYQWIAGLWTNCEVLQLNQNQSAIILCGHGRQYREVMCADTRSNYKKVNEDFCDPLLRPDSEKPCYLFCPQDCVVSNWSSWSQCTECISGRHHFRKRKILRKPGPSGLPCPSLSESEECVLNDNCFQYKWILGGWSSCILPEEVICGEGRQQRALFCLRSDGRQVDATFCSKVEKPITSSKYLIKSCFVDCPIDCVLSEWSEWDMNGCQQCGQSGVMKRNRWSLHSNSDSGQPCPQHLVQHKPCPFHPCYHWKVSPWSECYIQGADCGFGVRQREAQCLSDNGTIMENKNCLLVNFSIVNDGWIDTNWVALAYDIQEEEECHIPCPGDCDTTSWSEWSFCHRDCLNGEKVGYQTRSRAILALPAKSSSEKCPHEMWQSKPCWDGPCFTFEWKMLNESMECVRSDGLPVNGGCQDKPRPCLHTCQQPHARCNHAVGECDCDPGFVPVYALNTQPLEEVKRRLTGERSGSRDEASVRVEISETHVTGDGEVGLLVRDTVLDQQGRRRLIKCEMLVTMDTGQQPNHSTTTEEIILKYYPDENETSFWMYAMISIGSAFVIFVFVTVYLMCRSTIRQRMVSVQRQASVRRRVHSPEDPNSPWKSSQCE